MNPYDYKRRQNRQPAPYQLSKPAPMRRAQVPDNWDTTRTDLNYYKMTPYELAAKRAQRAPRYRYNEPLVANVYHATDYLGELYQRDDEYVKDQIAESLESRKIHYDNTPYAILDELDSLRKRVAELSKPANTSTKRQAVNSREASYSEASPRQHSEEYPKVQSSAPAVNELLLYQINRLTERLVNLYVQHSELSDLCSTLKIQNDELSGQLRSVQVELYALRQSSDSQEMAELDDVLERMKIL